MSKYKKYYQTIEAGAISRFGPDSPKHVSHLYAIKKYVKKDWSLLDIGCGSGSTLEALINNKISVKYKGVDYIRSYVKWCKEQWPDYEFEYQDATKLKEKDKSWDVTYSRGVLENLPNFKIGLDEQCRVARRLVVIILWKKLQADVYHYIQRLKGKDVTYHEYSNYYSKGKILKEIKIKRGWELIEFAEQVGQPNFIVIVLGKKPWKK